MKQLRLRIKHWIARQAFEVWMNWSPETTERPTGPSTAPSRIEVTKRDGYLTGTINAMPPFRAKSLILHQCNSASCLTCRMRG